MSAEGCYVCPLSLVMRTRLLCGLYNRRAVRPRLRPLAQAYCITLLLTFGLYSYTMIKNLDKLGAFHWTICYSQFFLSSIISLRTGDEYIYEYYTRNAITDNTLDSPMIFKLLRKHIKKAYVAAVLVGIAHFLINVAAWYNIGFNLLMFYVVPLNLQEIIIICSLSTKLLIMGLFNSRVLVMRRRLERYGFRTVRRTQAQPYCQIHDEILRGLDAMDNPLKILLFFDLIFSCGRIGSSLLYLLYGVLQQALDQIQFISYVLYTTIGAISNVVYLFAHVAMLESAETHCENMTVFTVTQLIKSPTADERRRMHQLLDALAARGARYHVLRAVPLDTRLVLQLLGFCTAQVLVFINMVKPF